MDHHKSTDTIQFQPSHGVSTYTCVRMLLCWYNECIATINPQNYMSKTYTNQLSYPNLQ